MRSTLAFRVCTMLLLCGVTLAPSAMADALADTFTFSDQGTTESFSFSTNNQARVQSSSCFLTTSPPVEEFCQAFILPPSAGATVTKGLPLELVISEPDGVSVSDIVSIFEPDYLVQFTSEANGVPLGLCSTFGGCQKPETGTVQEAGTITWSDGTVDTIKFASDINETSAVPEPSSIFLLGTGWLGVAGAVRRKLFS